jgi:hypothetical protein
VFPGDQIDPMLEEYIEGRDIANKEQQKGTGKNK